MPRFGALRSAAFSSLPGELLATVHDHLRCVDAVLAEDLEYASWRAVNTFAENGSFQP